MRVRRCHGTSEKGRKMTFLSILLALISLAIAAVGVLPSHSKPSRGLTPESSLGPSVTQGGDKLVYADFETVSNNRTVSNRGGSVQLYKYEESPSGLVR